MRILIPIDASRLSQIGMIGGYVLLIACGMARGTTVWSGSPLAFEKLDGVSPTLDTAQDLWIAGVVITRGNSGGGLYNAAAETSFDRSASPVGTLWAFAFNNPGKTLAAKYWKDLEFAVWTDAFGANANGGPPGIVDQPSVAYVVAEDLYVDVKLTGWTVRAGGGFSYVRASSPPPGDYNADGFIDDADYQVWAQSYGTSDTRSGGNGDEIVDAADYVVWRDNSVEVGAPVSVPEPMCMAHCVVVLLCVRRTDAIRCNTRRNP